MAPLTSPEGDHHCIHRKYFDGLGEGSEGSGGGERDGMIGIQPA